MLFDDLILVGLFFLHKCFDLCIIHDYLYAFLVSLFAFFSYCRICFVSDLFYFSVNVFCTYGVSTKSKPNDFPISIGGSNIF